MSTRSTSLPAARSGSTFALVTAGLVLAAGALFTTQAVRAHEGPGAGTPSAQGRHQHGHGGARAHMHGSGHAAGHAHGAGHAAGEMHAQHAAMAERHAAMHGGASGHHGGPGHHGAPQAAPQTPPATK